VHALSFLLYGLCYGFLLGLLGTDHPLSFGFSARSISLCIFNAGRMALYTNPKRNAKI
jgi:hypothetical protein